MYVYFNSFVLVILYRYSVCFKVLHAFTADCPVYKQFENNLINDPDWVQKRKENQASVIDNHMLL